MGKGTGEIGMSFGWLEASKHAPLCQHCMTWRAPPLRLWVNVRSRDQWALNGEQRDSSNTPESGSSITGQFLILPELSVPVMGCVCAVQHL